VLTGIATSTHHNGGGLVFGPHGLLYASTGDAEDPSAAPDRTSLNGKVLRITDAGEAAPGNPFGNQVWSYGHRNVEGLRFDEHGRLWASEVGDKGADELNLVVGGRDYGWPAVEGSDGRGGYADPFAQWPVDECSPSGIAVAAGRAWLGALQGECVWSVVLDGARAGRTERHLAGAYGRIRSVALAPDGSLWVGTSNRDGRTQPRSGDDRLLRLTL
jgi:glucose/arabinose dehydrogenase